MLESLRPQNKFEREEFHVLALKAHNECGTDLVETCRFLELHEGGNPHPNCLVRSGSPYCWPLVSEKLYEEDSIRVNFAPRIHTWARGILYVHVRL